VTTSSDQPGPVTIRLAEQHRDLREGALVSLTQSDLGQALTGAKGAFSPAAVSWWGNPASGRLVPASRVDAYARLFYTPHSFEGGVHLLGDAELTHEERSAVAAFMEELVGLREFAVGRPAPLGRPGPCAISLTARPSRCSAHVDIQNPPTVGEYGTSTQRSRETMALARSQYSGWPGRCTGQAIHRPLTRRDVARTGQRSRTGVQDARYQCASPTAS
jgi:hypothetical protein